MTSSFLQHLWKTSLIFTGTKKIFLGKETLVAIVSWMKICLVNRVPIKVLFNRGMYLIFGIYRILFQFRLSLSTLGFGYADAVPYVHLYSDQYKKEKEFTVDSTESTARTVERLYLKVPSVTIVLTHQWRTVRVFPGYSPSGENQGAVSRFENLNGKQWGISINW